MDLIERFSMECNDTCPIQMLTVQIIFSQRTELTLPEWKHCNKINRLSNVGLQLKQNYTYDQFCKFGFIFTLILKKLFILFYF